MWRWLIGSVLVGCGQTPVPSADAAADAPVDDARNTECGVDAGPATVYYVGPGPICAPCPPAEPLNGATCASVGLACEYGEGETLDCNTLAVCDLGDGGGAWRTKQKGKPCGQRALTFGGPCPTSTPSSGCCDVPYGVSCGYHNTECACVDHSWSCVARPCESRRLGCPCIGEGKICPRCGGTGPVAICTNARWSIGDPCPDP